MRKGTLGEDGRAGSRQGEELASEPMSLPWLLSLLQLLGKPDVTIAQLRPRKWLQLKAPQVAA